MTPTESLPARSDHAMAYDGERVSLFGGFGFDRDDEPLGDTWAWDGVEWNAIETELESTP